LIFIFARKKKASCITRRRYTVGIMLNLKLMHVQSLFDRYSYKFKNK